MNGVVAEGRVFASRYRIVRLLGTGAMGAVYEVLDIDTDRRRALKVMHAPFEDGRDDGERWKHEARIAGKIDSQFIVDVLDVGVDQETGARFLVMELLAGEDLSKRLKRRGPLPPDEVARCLHQAAQALDRMHRAGIIHRDLKPGNLFLDEREQGAPRLKILDFGVAVEGGLRDGGRIAGTPMYMAPEQFRDDAQVDAATDVFALGMVAFALLTGRAYWSEEWERCTDRLDFALIAVRGPSAPACVRGARYGATLPPAFDAWFACAAAAESRARFPSAGVAVTALHAALGLRAPETASAETAQPGATLASSMAGFAAPVESSLGLGSTVTAAEVLAHASTQPVESRPRHARRRGRWQRGLVALALAVIVGLVLGPTLDRTASPLAAPGSVLGCPVLAVFGFGDRAGWLGAAAAALLCERARVVLGGTTGRTRLPAELLALPREPTDDFPRDPYADGVARSQTLLAARRLDAYLDGEITSSGDGFLISIALRSGAGELARSQGRGRALFVAARTAMQPLIDKGLLPRARSLDPVIADFSQARDITTALALLDLSIAMINNAGELADECRSIEGFSDRTGEQAATARFLCAYTLGLPLPDVRASSRGDHSPGAVAARARLQHIAHRGDDRARADEIVQLLDTERSPWGRSVLAATASCLLQASDPRRAADMARRAVQAEPKNPTGESCAPWVQLVSVTQGTTSVASAARAMQAWAPWDGYGWLLDAVDHRDGSTALEYARRAYALSPLDTYIAQVFAERLLARGGREQARGIALALESGGHPVHRLASVLLRVRIDASQARFRAALDRARRAMTLSPEDSGWIRVQRLEIAWRALELTEVLGGQSTAQTADLIVAEFLDRDPTVLDGGHLDVPLRIPAICARASARVGERCFRRFRTLRNSLSGGILPDTDAFTDGAQRYALGDFHGAARAWRPLLQNPTTFAAVMFDAMVEAFERTGETNLVERLFAAVPDRSAELGGATLAVVRQARWAARHGEPARARALAQQVIDAWSVADDTVPAVTEMHALLTTPP